MKKAQSISINTIIVAAIALAVLVVLFMIFTGRLGRFSFGVEKTTDCPNACIAAGNNKGGIFKSSCQTDTEIQLIGYSSPNPQDPEGERLKCCCTRS